MQVGCHNEDVRDSDVLTKSAQGPQAHSVIFIILHYYISSVLETAQ